MHQANLKLIVKRNLILQTISFELSAKMYAAISMRPVVAGAADKALHGLNPALRPIFAGRPSNKAVHRTPDSESDPE
jgi:hypothetical protein